MNDEKLEIAKSLKGKIVKAKEHLDAIYETVEEVARLPENCSIRACNETVTIDSDIADIALIVQEKRVNLEISRLCKKFEDL